MSTEEPVLYVAAKAILVNPEGKVLILREADATYEEGTMAGRYHGAIGGRIDPSETYAEGLRREVAEETGITDIEPLYPIYVGEWWPLIKGRKRHIVAIFTVCKVDSSEIRLSEEHDDYQWISLEETGIYDILPAYRDALNAYAERRSLSR